MSVHCLGNILHVGDHIPWHQPLDGGKESRIQHMLVAEEPQLLDLDTPYGTAQFRQVTAKISSLLADNNAVEFCFYLSLVAVKLNYL